MKEMTIYKVKIYEFKESSKTGKVYKKHYTTRFFKSEDEIKDFMEKRSKEDYKIETGTFNQFRDEITISDYDILFGTQLSPNNELRKDDLYNGMWVWDDTRKRYCQIYQQQLPLIQSDKYITCYETSWYDSFGIRVSSHKLYRYNPDLQNPIKEISFNITP